MNYREPDGEKIYREECQYCFEQKYSQEGLFVCMFCDSCCCQTHAILHFQKSGHNQYVKFLNKLIDEQSYQQLEQKLKLQKFEELVESTQSIYQIENNVLVQIEADDEQCVCSALIGDCPNNDQYRYLKPSSSQETNVKTNCYHMNLIPDVNQQHPHSQVCKNCQLTNNLWLCLQCGQLSCGRKNWDGSGGNGHALQHFQQTKHAVSLKITSCCKSLQEVYCYECDDMVPINQYNIKVLRKLLSQFHLEYVLDRGTATEISMMEQVTQNQLSAQKQQKQQEFQIDQGILRQLNLLPLENTGNTCFANAAMNCLIHTQAFQLVKNHQIFCKQQVQQCFLCQCERLTNGLLSDKQVMKQQPHLTNLLLSMNSYLTNADNIGKQQDALEFIQLFLKRFNNVFQLPATRKEVKCQLCGFCQYSEGIKQDNLSLTCNFFDKVVDGETGMPIDLADSLYRDLAGLQKPVFQFKCKQCGVQNIENEEMTIRVGQSFVDKLPQKLMVVVNRLFYDSALQKVCKLRTQIQNAMQVDFSKLYGQNEQNRTEELAEFDQIKVRAALKYCGGNLERARELLLQNKISTDPSDQLHFVLANKQCENEAKYQLSCMIEHVGQSYDCGHYVCYCNTNLGWVKCNDDKFSIVAKEEVPCQDAYILFYEQK